MTVTYMNPEKKREPRPVHGRLPPHDLDAEQAVLVTVMLLPDAIDELSNILAPSDFYSPANGSIFEAALELRRAGQPTDASGIGSWLRDRERLASVGGAAYIAQILANDVASLTFARDHAKAVARKRQMRAIIAEAQAIAAEGYGDVGDSDAWVDESAGRLAAIADGRTTKDLVTLGEEVRRYFSALEAESSGDVAPAGGRFGLIGVDRLVGDLALGDLTIVGGYPGDGKSALGLQAAVATASEVRPDPSAVLVVTAEMSGRQIAKRAVFSRASVDSARARPRARRPLDIEAWRALTDSAQALHELPIWVEDRAGLEIDELAGIVRRHASAAKRKGTTLRLVMVDYLQLLHGRRRLAKGANRENEVAAIAYGLKYVAKATGVHVLALAQLNDDASKRRKEDARPTSADFRESKAIWMASDNCLLIHNPAARERSKAARKPGDSADPEQATLILDKQRGGLTGSVPVVFWPHLTRFEDAPGETDDHARYAPRWEEGG